jgi:hypothetical protein
MLKRLMNRVMNRLTYANVTATMALVLALGGTSYAAMKLPGNSVGSAQIRTGAVGSSEIHDRSIRLQDISRATRTSLHGAAGPAGAPGPAGAAAAKHFAAVSSSGALVRGDAKSGGRAGSPGTYVVGFAESVSGCAYSATLGTTDGTTVPAGRVTVNDQAGSVGVQTYDANGASADLPFHLIVAC